MRSNADRDAEIQGNYEAFKTMLPDLLKEHRGRYAVLHHRELVEVMDTVGDAVRLAVRLYPDGEFSVQKVTDRAINLGWFSNVGTDI